jgi:hypothetical protein
VARIEILEWTEADRLRQSFEHLPNKRLVGPHVRELNALPVLRMRHSFQAFSISAVSASCLRLTQGADCALTVSNRPLKTGVVR